MSAFGWSGAQSDGRTRHLLSRLLMLISCHVCSRCVSRALYPSYWHAPSLHYIVTHWCVHSPSLCISPLLCLLLVPVFASVARVPRHSSTLFSSSPPQVPSCHPPTSITYTFSPSNLIFLTSFTPSLCRPLSVSHTPFLPSFSCRPTLHTCFFSPRSPLLLLPPPVFVPNLSAGSYVGCSVKSATGAAMEAQNEWWWLCLFCKVVVCCDLVRRRCLSFFVQSAPTAGASVCPVSVRVPVHACDAPIPGR